MKSALQSGGAPSQPSPAMREGRPSSMGDVGWRSLDRQLRPTASVRASLTMFASGGGSADCASGRSRGAVRLLMKPLASPPTRCLAASATQPLLSPNSPAAAASSASATGLAGPTRLSSCCSSSATTRWSGAQRISTDGPSRGGGLMERSEATAAYRPATKSIGTSMVFAAQSTLRCTANGMTDFRPTTRQPMQQIPLPLRGRVRAGGAKGTNLASTEQ